MRWTRAFIPTLKETPSDAEVVSHQLMLRAGMMRQHAAGVYSYLPFGWRTMKKVMEIVREEMDRIGCQEYLLPSLTRDEIWEKTNRLQDMGHLMFKLKDRRESLMCLAPTHEEVFTEIASFELRSYRDMPQMWYQIQTKFRDEARPRSGVLRSRQFLMKDAYSFNADYEGLDVSYKLQREAYERIFTRCGLKFFVVGASSGIMGGSASEEFMVESPNGEDKVAHCKECGYAANLEVATSIPKPIKAEEADEYEEVHTPEKRTIEQVSSFLKMSPKRFMKSLLYIADDKAVMVLVRGDHEVNEAKLQSEFGADVRPAHPEEVLGIIGANVGFIGPVGLEGKVKIVADEALKDGVGLVTGANKDQYHLVGLSINRDVHVDKFVDLRSVKAGEGCPECSGKLDVVQAIEIGHIFKLGTKYSKSLNATFLNENGEQTPVVMGSYGIGIERIVACAIELGHDKNGIIWPMSIAPYQAIILGLDMSNDEIASLSEEVYNLLSDNGIEVLYDDRDYRPGFKFKDADLVGIPIKIVIGKRTIKQGKIEIELRGSGEQLKVEKEELVSTIKNIIQEQTIKV